MLDKMRDEDTTGAYQILKEIRSGQVHDRQEHKEQYRNLANALGTQNAALNQLSTDVAALSVRTSMLEIELQKQSVTVHDVKERQDGCAARITHDADNTEIRDLRSQLHKAVARRMTPFAGVSVHRDERIAWWSTTAGKAVLGALAGLLVAATTAITTWAAMSPSSASKAEAAQEAAQEADLGQVGDVSVWGDTGTGSD